MKERKKGGRKGEKEEGKKEGQTISIILPFQNIIWLGSYSV